VTDVSAWLGTDAGLNWTIRTRRQPAGAAGLFGDLKQAWDFSVSHTAQAPWGPPDARFDPSGAPPLSDPRWHGGPPYTGPDLNGMASRPEPGTRPEGDTLMPETDGGGNQPLPPTCPCGHPGHGPGQCLAVAEVEATYGPGGGIHDRMCACPLGDGPGRDTGRAL
jgi:hypothetical protein